MQSRGDVEAAVKLIQDALELDEACEYAYETLGTIGAVFINVFFLRRVTDVATKILLVTILSFLRPCVGLDRNSLNLDLISEKGFRLDTVSKTALMKL
jgi:hypothetical protein